MALKSCQKALGLAWLIWEQALHQLGILLILLVYLLLLQALLRSQSII